MAQDIKNHVFPVDFCVVDKEWDVYYKYFLKQMRSNVDDTDEWYIISHRHPSIRNMVLTIYHGAHYDCCLRHLRENVRNNFHNLKVVSLFYKAEGVW